MVFPRLRGTGWRAEEAKIKRTRENQLGKVELILHAKMRKFNCISSYCRLLRGEKYEYYSRKMTLKSVF